MKACSATGLAFAWSLAACLAQGDFYLRSASNHGVTTNAPANWYSGTFSAEVWEFNAHSIPPILNTVASLSPIAAYSLLGPDGFQLEQTFVSQTCNNGFFSLGEIDMGSAWAGSTVVIVLAAWNTDAPNWIAMLAKADSNTRAGVIAWTQTTGDLFDSLHVVPGMGAWNQDLVLMPVASSPISPPAGTQAQGFTYNTNNGAITVTEYTGPGGSVAIPSAIQGLPVVSISSYAFYSRPGLTNVSIPDGVTNIGNLAFYACTGLTAITVETLNSSYASQDGALFNKPLTTLIQCPGGKVGNYAIPEGVTNVADNALAVCPSLTTVTMPDSLASIGDWAFFDCTSLTSVAIPDNVTTLGNGAFLGCASLTNVTIGDSVIGIGAWTFGDCISLTNATIGNAVSNVGTGAFQGCVNLTRLTIPSGVTSIGASALADCTSLASLSIGDSVTNIGDLAFADCTNLTSISISSSVASIGDSAFTNCTSLAAITVDASNLVYSSLEGVLFDKSQTTLIAYPQGRGGDFTIPEGVTSIRDYAFYGCASVNSITIPGSVSGIGSETFFGCASLTNVTIGNGVGSIGEGAFYACANLPGIAMPNSVTSIGDNAFASCSSLTNCIIPNSVTNVGGGAFSGCSRLGSIIIGEGVISIGSSAFIQSGLTSVNIPDSVVSIGSAAFRQCGSLTNVLMGHGVTNIADYTFFACTGLRQITILGSVTSIGEYAFCNCQSLTSIALPDSLISVGEGAFNYCSSLCNVVIGHRLTSIGVFAFEWCALASVELPNSVTYIGISAFAGCGSLTNVVIPNSVSEIGPGTFLDCFNLISVYFEGDAPTVASSSFGGSSPTVYYLPGTKGWSPTFSGLPTVCWNPQVQTDDGGFGVQHNQFGFNVRGTSNLVVLVEASTNLASPIWSPLTTNTLSTSSFHFNDPQWTNYPGRFYRLRWP